MVSYDEPIGTSDLIDMRRILGHLDDAVSFWNAGGLRGEEYPAVWPSLVARLKKSADRYHSGLFGVVKVMTGVMAGRVMVTFENGGRDVTLLGDDGDGDGKRGCGLHSIHSSAREAVWLIETAVVNWDITLLKPDHDAVIDAVAMAGVKKKSPKEWSPRKRGLKHRRSEGVGTPRQAD